MIKPSTINSLSLPSVPLDAGSHVPARILFTLLPMLEETNH